MRETTRDGTGPVGNWSRRRSADERGGRRLVQRARYPHKNWTSFWGLHKNNTVNFGGSYGQITGASLDGTTAIYNFSASYDQLDRTTDLRYTLAGNGSTLFDQTTSYDPAGNVKTLNTTLSAGTDNQAFCYDEQNRLTAAASSGTVPCQTFTAGTLTGANYNQTSAYDTLGRLTSGPLGSYNYGTGAPVHGARAIGTAYTAAYDAAGNMTCRAPSSSTTCSGTQTGAQLTYNNEGQFSNWLNQPSGTTSAACLYDPAGNRVAQQVTSGGSTTTTVFVGNVEEDVTSGASTTKKTFYYANGWRFATQIISGGSGTFDYLASDELHSANVTLNAGGGVVASVLYAPYGSARYSSGVMPIDRGFTGQVVDTTTGLDYYISRFYDPVAGQFASPDSVIPGSGFDIWGLSRYAYVEGNPIVRTDPSGHRVACEDDSTCGNFYGSGGPTGHAHGKPPTTHPSKSSKPVPAIANPSLTGRSSGNFALEQNDPYDGWPQNMRTDYDALEGNLTSFWEKIGELITDDGSLFVGKPGLYVQHIEAIRAIQAKMLARFLELQKVDPEVAAALAGEVEAAQNFDPVAVRGLPEGYAESSDGEIFRPSELGTDGTVDPFDPGGILPEPIDPIEI